jgi:alpha-1,6-mannosyltransferase
MPERVPLGTGVLGPVDDQAAMAANVEHVWVAGARAMGLRARQVALGYGWPQTFERLLETIYPAAMVNRDARLTRRRWSFAPRGDQAVAG